MMETIGRNFGHLSWWITVVAFGLLVNILASYLKPFLERLASTTYSGVARVRRDYLKGIEFEVANIRSTPDYRISAQLLKVEYLIKFIGATALTVYVNRMSAESQADLAWSRMLGMAGGVSGWYAALCLGRYSRFSDTLARAWKAERAHQDSGG